ncbi:MAG: hypothetical protein CSA34_03355 [Desulfobulbus propionicus]|nr:MAG: hypothetical protein CSA34_03355 [Desulfobulbus propionicus]
MIRRTFYLIIGFSFPFFWTFHANGLLKALYLPIKRFLGIQSSLWPSLFTAILVYGLIIFIFELLLRTREDLQI